MSDLRYDSFEEYVAGLCGLRGMVSADHVGRLHDVVYALMGFALRDHAHELAERQRAELDRMNSSPGYLADTEWAARAMKLPDLIDPEVTT